MEYKLLEEQDLELMLDFVDDENTKYSTVDLKEFIDGNNNFGFVAKTDNKIVGFAFGYILLYPDGRKVFYIHAIDVMPEYQGKGYVAFRGAFRWSRLSSWYESSCAYEKARFKEYRGQNQ